MNEITRVHLARMPYDIEIPAKKELEQYLSAVQASMQTDEDMMFEVESRIVELLAEHNIAKGGVITRADIAQVREQLGEPRDFAADPDEGGQEQESEVAVRPAVRLYRDSQAAWLGGVAAGIAARTALPVLLVRLAIIILAVASFGVVLVGYILAWVLMPDAKTAAQRLEMRGEPVTLSALTNLENSVVAAVDHAKRPLVVMLRVLIALGGLLVMAGAIAALVVMGTFLVANSTMIADQDGSSTIIALAVVTGFGLLLLAAFAMIVTYAGAAWRVTKRMVVAASAVIAVGLTMAMIAFGTLVVMGVPLTSSYDGRGYTSESKQTQLADISKLHVEGAGSGVSVNYVAVRSVDEHRVETFNSPLGKKVSVAIAKDGDAAVVRITATGECWKLYGECLDWGHVTVFGPALDEYHGVSYREAYYPDEDENEAAVEDEQSDE